MTSRAPDAQPSAFTTLWTGDQCRRLERSGVVGKAVTLTFGGPHTSAPRYSRAGVRPGDLVYPINVQSGRLRVIARFRVAELIPAEEFLSRAPERFATIAPAHPLLRLEQWIAADPVIAAQCPGEAEEAVVAVDSTPVTLNATVPVHAVPRLRWRSGRLQERPIKHLGPDGRVTSTISLQGVYRLAEGSAVILDAALARQDPAEH